MLAFQSQVTLPAYSRGCHLITRLVVDSLPELKTIRIGQLQVFIQHTSASLTINENADPDVRRDMAMALDRIAPESWPYIHTCEGSDDMPAHIKSSLMGASVTIPIRGGSLALGTWQGIYLCEHRDAGGRRSLVVTAMGVA